MAQCQTGFKIFTPPQPCFPVDLVNVRMFLRSVLNLKNAVWEGFFFVLQLNVYVSYVYIFDLTLNMFYRISFDVFKSVTFYFGILFSYFLLNPLS